MHIFKHTKPPVGGGKSLNEWVIVSFNWFVQNAESFSKQNTKCADLSMELFSLVK